MVGIGQIGAGYWGKNLLRNFASLEQARVHVVCEADPERRAALARRYPEITFVEDVEALLSHPNVEAVVIATPTPTHYPLARRALEADRHVFVEKPMAQRAQEAEELARLAEQKGRVLMVGHLLLYHPAFRFVERLIDEGTLGEVFYLYSVRVNLGIIRQQENAFESLAPHDLSLALQYLKKRPVKVAAQGQAYLQPGIEDVVFASVTFEGGQMAHLHTSWLDPHKVRKMTVVGNRKMAVIDDMEAVEKVRVYDKGVDLKPGERLDYGSYAEAISLRVGDIWIPRIPMQEPLRLECEHFIECIRQGKKPRSDAENGLEVVRLLEAARTSLMQGGKAITL